MNSKTNPDKEADTILVVEDSRTQAEQLKYLLEESHYKVMLAENGHQALALLAAHKPALIITDIIMPKMSGYELCEQIKSDKTTAGIPVILLTSLASPEDVLEGLSCGADSFITKPYSKDYLLSNIQQILANSGLRKTERVRIGVEILFAGKRRFITADQQQMLSLLISTYEAAVQRNRELTHTQDELRSVNEHLEGLVAERTAALSQEIIERKQAEEKVKHFNSIISAIRNVNKLITKEKDPDRLIRGACENLVATRGFTSAWIMLTEESEISAYCAETGMGESFRSLQDRIEKRDLPQCVRRALSQSSVVITEDISAECVGCPLLSANHGKSAFSVRLEHEGKVYGVLSASVPQGFALDQEEQNLFQEVGEDIAFGLYNIEQEEKRKKYEDVLKESEERFKILFEYAPDAIYLYDFEGRFADGNIAAEKLAGYGKAELIGKSFLELSLLSPEGLQKAAGLLQKSAQGLSTGPDELILVRKDGTQVFIEIRTFPISIKGQDLVLGIARDISERKNLEQQLQQSQKLEAVGRLSGGIAHDFNNLLTAVIGNAELILADVPKDDPVRNGVEEILAAGERAAILTRQMLAFSRKQVLQPEVINLNDTVRDMEKMLRRMIREDIELRTILFPDLGQVEADAGQIEQVIMNLVVNARDAVSGSGKISIETGNVELGEEYARAHIAVTPGPHVMLSVSDNGIGMSREIQAHIFEPFFTTKAKGKGTGLGLSVVYGIVKQSNGNIWAYSEPGKGTTFKIYLPRVEKPRSGTIQKVQRTDTPTGSETILVVEDDEIVRNFAVRVLKGYGYKILTAANGEEAVKVSREHQGTIDLMLTDVVMPGISSRDMEESLKSSRPEMRVLYMSGYTDNTIVHHGVLDTAKAFIGKPFTPDALGRKVREVLDLTKQ